MTARPWRLAGRILALLACLASRGWGQGDPGLAVRLDALLGQEGLRSASIGLLVIEAESGRTLYERDADRALVPASNMKLVTAFAALAGLGADFRYTTAVCAEEAPTAAGWVVGDLYLRGAGDPTLTSGDLARLVEQLARRGLTRVTGSVVGDGTCFSGPPLGDGWAWDDETHAYSAQVSGLTVDGNAVLATVEAGPEVGKACRLRLEPPSQYLRLAADCRSGPADGTRPAVFRRRAENVVATTGPVPLGSSASARVTVEEPARYAACLFTQMLVDRGIEVGGEPRGGLSPVSAVVLASHRSAPLAAIVRQMNKPSDNNIAEALLRALAVAAGAPGTDGEGSAIVEACLKEAGVDTGPLRLRDGSGLSRLNLLTPRAIVTVLRQATLDEAIEDAFLLSLPIAGVDGTLAGRMKAGPARGRVRAKTGTLLGVSALSGYVDGGSPGGIVFSILVNNHVASASEARGLQDAICEVLAEHAVH